MSERWLTCEYCNGLEQCPACAWNTCWCLLDAHGVDLQEWNDDDRGWDICHDSLPTCEDCVDNCCGECGGTQECPECGGEGAVPAFECPSCEGDGAIRRVFTKNENEDAEREVEASRRRAEEFALRRRQALTVTVGMGESIEGFVYAIADSDENVKFGWAQDVRQRRKELQTGNPRPLEILAAVPASQADERTLHHQLAQYRLSGEWFDLRSPTVQAVVERLRTTGCESAFRGVAADQLRLGSAA